MMKQVTDINRLFEENGAIGKNRISTESYVSLPEADFAKIMSGLAGKDIILIGLFAAENFESHPGFSLFYVFQKRNNSMKVVSGTAVIEPQGPGYFT